MESPLKGNLAARGPHINKAEWMAGMWLSLLVEGDIVRELKAPQFYY